MCANPEAPFVGALQGCPQGRVLDGARAAELNHGGAWAVLLQSLQADRGKLRARLAFATRVGAEELCRPPFVVPADLGALTWRTKLLLGFGFGL